MYIYIYKHIPILYMYKYLVFHPLNPWCSFIGTASMAPPTDPHPRPPPQRHRLPRRTPGAPRRCGSVGWRSARTPRRRWSSSPRWWPFLQLREAHIMSFISIIYNINHIYIYIYMFYICMYFVCFFTYLDICSNVDMIICIIYVLYTSIIWLSIYIYIYIYILWVWYDYVWICIYTYNYIHCIL